MGRNWFSFRNSDSQSCTIRSNSLANAENTELGQI